MWFNWALLQELIDHYHAPPQANQELVELCHGLREFQDIIQEHAHLEDNILFRKTVSLEGAIEVLKGSGQGR
jgi:iron-sulfur cluster repair protein YtfE (RIC family)